MTKAARFVRHIWGILVLFALTMTGFAGLAGPGVQPNYGGTLTVARDQDALGLDPHLEVAASSHRVIELVYSFLVRYDEQMQLVPDLATSWETPDPKTFVFKLRRGVRFHNRREVVAADVKYSIERILNPETRSPGRSFYAMVEAIDTPDRYTVVFKLNQAFSPFVNQMAIRLAAIVPREVVEQQGGLRQVAVGSGPFKLTEWVRDSHIKFEKNRDYHDRRLPYVDSLVFQIVPDGSARLAYVRAGRVHITEVTAKEAELLANERDVRLVSTATTSYWWAGFNTTRAPFTDSRVRQAVSCAIDREQIVKVALNGRAAVTGPIPPILSGWAVRPDELVCYKPDPVKARELLAAAGHAQAFRTTIKTTPSQPIGLEISQILQSQLRAVGIDATIVPVEWGIYVSDWRQSNMDIMVGRNVQRNTPDELIYNDFTSSGGANVWRFNDRQIDAWANEARQTADASRLKVLYTSIQKRMAELSPMLFLAAPTLYDAVRANVMGYRPLPSEQRSYLMEAWLR